MARVAGGEHLNSQHSLMLKLQRRMLRDDGRYLAGITLCIIAFQVSLPMENRVIVAVKYRCDAREDL